MGWGAAVVVFSMTEFAVARDKVRSVESSPHLIQADGNVRVPFQDVGAGCWSEDHSTP